MKDINQCCYKKNYVNWYVLSTIAGRECSVKKSIDKLFDNRFKLYIPCRELFYSISGCHKKITKTLFPGYIFIHKEIEELVKQIRHTYLDGRIHPICHNCRFAKVNEEEMAFLMKITDLNGIVRISEGIFDENQTIKITSGPLKDFNGHIMFINKRKKKAKIQIRLLNRDVHVTLGVDILNII